MNCSRRDIADIEAAIIDCPNILRDVDDTWSKVNRRTRLEKPGDATTRCELAVCKSPERTGNELFTDEPFAAILADPGVGD